MNSDYETNAARYDQAVAEAHTWAQIITADDAHRTMHDYLLGALMAQTDPATFAEMIERAEQFAGKPE